MLLKEGDFVDRKLGVTQDYDRSNYDSARAKRTYKEKAFGDSAVITDPTTGEILHKSQTAAQNKYQIDCQVKCNTIREKNFEAPRRESEN